MNKQNKKNRIYRATETEEKHIKNGYKSNKKNKEFIAFLGEDKSSLSRYKVYKMLGV